MPITASRASASARGFRGSGVVRYTVTRIGDSASTATNSAQITVTMPSHVDGDTLLLCIAYSDVGAAGTTGITDDLVSQGWTLVVGHDDDDLDFAVYQRTAASEPAYYSVTTSVNFDCAVALVSSYRKTGGTLTMVNTSVNTETSPGSSGFLYWSQSSTIAHYNVTAVGFAAGYKPTSLSLGAEPDYYRSYTPASTSATTGAHYLRVDQWDGEGSHAAFGNSGNIAYNSCYYGRAALVMMYAE